MSGHAYLISSLSIDPFWTWETIVFVVAVEVHRSFVSPVWKFSSERRVLNDINSLNRRAIKQLLLYFCAWNSFHVRSLAIVLIIKILSKRLVRNVSSKFAFLCFTLFYEREVESSVEFQIIRHTHDSNGHGMNSQRLAFVHKSLVGDHLKSSEWERDSQVPSIFLEWFSHFTQRKADGALN